MCAAHARSDRRERLRRGEPLGDLRLFEVDFTGGSTRVPVALVQLAADARDTPALFEALVAEYWAPTLPWQIYEHLGSAIRVGDQLPVPGPWDFEVDGAMWLLHLDRQRAQQHFGAR